MKQPRRTGKTFMVTPTDCPAHTMKTLGFDTEQIKRMMRARRILPYVEARTEPCLDARKLWEQIGKPWGKFASWTSHEEKAFSVFMEKGEVVTRQTITKGRPRTDYTLSRDCAAQLAMAAGTEAGFELRQYFLDMEALAMSLARHTPIRAGQLAATDNKVTHAAHIRAGKKAKAGKLASVSVRFDATTQERRLKSLVCEVLTGISTSRWRELTGLRIRDVLDSADLNIYAQTYDVAAAMFAAGMHKDSVEGVIAANWRNVIDVEKYKQAATANSEDF